MRTGRYLGFVTLIGVLCTPFDVFGAAIGYVGTAGFGSSGVVFDDSCFTCVQSYTSNVAFGLPDGLSFSGTVNESIAQVGGFTASAYLRITNIVVQDTSGLPINDNIYLFSDAFSPSLVGTGGVGILGYYGNVVLPRGGPVAASVQAQMQFELVAVQPGTLTLGSSLTTPPTFVNCAACSPLGFHEFARGPILLGTTQLVGVVNFRLSGLGSAVYLPGSVILDDNDPALARSEVPETDSVRLVLSGLLGMLLMFRRRLLSNNFRDVGPGKCPCT